MPLAPLLIQGPRIIDAYSGMDQVGDILIVDGEISIAGPVYQESLPEGCAKVDATGLVACPGFIDLHCHLRAVSYTHLTLPTNREV